MAGVTAWSSTNEASNDTIIQGHISTLIIYIFKLAWWDFPWVGDLLYFYISVPIGWYDIRT